MRSAGVRRRGGGLIVSTRRCATRFSPRVQFASSTFSDWIVFLSRTCVTTGGIILCGGRSSRMRRSKALLPFGDETMLQRIVRLMRSVVRPIVVVAAPRQRLPILPADVLIARDAIEDQGPLQGFLAGLEMLPDEVDAVYLSSCDVPLLQPGFIQRMVDLLGEHAIAMPQVADRRHPLTAVYRREVIEPIKQLLKTQRRRLLDLAERCPTRFVEPAELFHVDYDLRSLRNVNTPEDYADVLRSLIG